MEVILSRARLPQGFGGGGGHLHKAETGFMEGLPAAAFPVHWLREQRRSDNPFERPAEPE